MFPTISILYVPINVVFSYYSRTSKYSCQEEPKQTTKFETTNMFRLEVVYILKDNNWLIQASVQVPILLISNWHGRSSLYGHAREYSKCTELLRKQDLLEEKAVPEFLHHFLIATISFQKFPTVWKHLENFQLGKSGNSVIFKSAIHVSLLFHD